MTIPDLETQKFEDKEIFWGHGNFRDTECFNVVNATLVYGRFNICTKYFVKNFAKNILLELLGGFLQA